MILICNFLFPRKVSTFCSTQPIHFKARIWDHLALMLKETKLSENQVMSPVNQSDYRDRYSGYK